MLLARIVETSQTVAATRSRKAKVAALATTLAEADVDEVEVVVAYLGGTLLPRRTGGGWGGRGVGGGDRGGALRRGRGGVGWRGVGSPPEPASDPSLTVAEVDA